MNAPYRIEGNRLSGYVVVNTESGRRYGVKKGHGRPYTILGAARRRMAELAREYEPVVRPTDPLGQRPPVEPRVWVPTAGFNRGTVIPKASLLPNELFEWKDM